MMKSLKKLGFFVITLVLTAFIFWLIFMDKQSKTDALDYTLGLLGDKLVAMIPNESGRKSVQEKFGDFVKQAKEQKVSPEQVEHVAANILNLSNAETELTSEQAEAVMDLSLATPLITSQGDCEIEVPSPPPPPEKWQNLEKRIQYVYEFNDKMREAIKEDSENKSRLAEQYHIQVQNGLIMAMHENMKIKFSNMEADKLQDKLKQLEEDQIVIWHKKQKDENSDEIKRDKHQINYYVTLKKLEEANINTEVIFKSIKILENLPTFSTINFDSLQIVIESSLKNKAGKKCDYQECDENRDKNHQECEEK
jgi:hypothetical protein